ncbi:pectate lyase-like adhesive domain-containing protein, partial [Limosilactobacillus reuteri]|uniref:pectate lyase-like adhesive domain-containing protein n=1 Tax=Limosilactobacillus reuteri TaxID=1598 RepID=UPI001786D660
PASSSAAPVSTVSDQQTSNTASANEQNQASGNESKATVATRANKLRITDKATILATANPSQGQTLEVNDWNSFGAALINQNVGNIVLTNDITAGGDVANAIKDNYGELDVTAKDIVRKVTIDGQGKYALNFGEKFLAFANANQGD